MFHAYDLQHMIFTVNLVSTAYTTLDTLYAVFHGLYCTSCCI